MRVVSLLPSATEILLAVTGPAALRSGNAVELVGRSHECDWPDWPELAAVPVLTGANTTFTTSAEVDRQVREQLHTGNSLYTLDAARLAALRPDVIITQDLCEVCSIDLKTVRAVASRMEQPPRVVSLNPQTFEGVLDDFDVIGSAIGLERRAMEVVVALRERAYRAEEHVNPYADAPSVAFLEWTDPLFIGGHWTPQLIERAGGSHPLNPSVAVEGAGAGAGPIGQTLRRAGKSAQVSPESLVASRPEHLIICPCGLSLERAWHEARVLMHKPWWGSLPAAQRGRVAVVDGNQMFNRPGPRLVDALEFLVGWLNGREDIIPSGFPWKPLT